MVYDFNDLVADVGGYLGLLLGQSAYGIFAILTQWMGRRKSIKCLLVVPDEPVANL